MITTIKLKTNEKTEFIDITKDVNPFTINVKEGFVIISTQHTTTGLWINEFEKGLINDLKTKLEILFPSTHYYEHDDFKKRICPENERRNGFSHLKSTFFQNSLIIPINSGKLALGKYQSVIFVELDGPREEREVIIQTCETK